MGGTGEEAQWENLVRASSYPVIIQVPPACLELLFLWSIGGEELLLHFAFRCSIMQQGANQINFFLYDSCSDVVRWWWILIITGPYFVKLLKFLVSLIYEWPQLLLRWICLSIMNLPKAITANHIDVVQLVVIYSLSQLLSSPNWIQCQSVVNSEIYIIYKRFVYYGYDSFPLRTGLSR